MGCCFDSAWIRRIGRTGALQNHLVYLYEQVKVIQQAQVEQALQPDKVSVWLPKTMK